jgi:Zn-finger nucleic acid-binding protein
MQCPNCSGEFHATTLAGHQGKTVGIDLCKSCQAFWFDKFESLQLAPGSTLQLMKMIGESGSPGPRQFKEAMSCPRCSESLRPTQDMQRNTRFSYFRCPNEHGRFTRFFEFLREKNFIRPLSGQQIEELRKHIQIVHCSSCGAPVNLATHSSCTHCRSPLSMLDMKQPQEMLAQLRDAAEPKPVDPTLPVQLAKAKREMEILFAGVEPDANWLRDASSDLVHACLASVARWLNKSGVS